jgi:hypothetical protein
MEIRQWTSRFSEQNLRITPDDVVGQLAHSRIPEPLIEPSRIVVKGGHAHKYIGRVSEDSLFREFEQFGANALAPPLGVYQHSLDETDEDTRHAQNEKPYQLSTFICAVDLSSVVPDNPKRRFEGTTERQPWLRGGHEVGAQLRIGLLLEWSYPDRVFGDGGNGHPALTSRPGLPNAVGGLDSCRQGWVPQHPDTAQQIPGAAVKVRDYMTLGHRGGAGKQQEVDVPYSFIERNCVDALGLENLFHRPNGCVQDWPECPGFGRSKLAQGLAVPVSLYDQLAGVALSARMVAHVPLTIIEDDPTRRP